MNYVLAAAVAAVLWMPLSTAGAADPPPGTVVSADKPAPAAGPQGGDAKAGKAADKKKASATKEDKAAPAAVAAPAAQPATDPDLAGTSARNRPASQSTVTTGTRGKPKAPVEGSADSRTEPAPAPAK